MLFDVLGLYPYYGHKILTWFRAYDVGAYLITSERLGAGQNVVIFHIPRGPAYMEDSIPRMGPESLSIQLFIVYVILARWS